MHINHSCFIYVVSYVVSSVKNPTSNHFHYCRLICIFFLGSSFPPSREREADMMSNILNPMWELEIRVLSCEGLNLISQSSSFSSWCSSFIFTPPANSKPSHFISVTKLPDHEPKVYSGRLQEGEGAGEGGVLRVPADSSFLFDTQSCLYLQIYQKRRILGPSQVGWCLVPASDIGPPPQHPPPSVRCLSYRLRGRDGCVVGAIINLSIQLKDTCEAAAPPAPAIGIPIGKTEERHIKSGC